jgi:hypothetical protein
MPKPEDVQAERARVKRLLAPLPQTPTRPAVAPSQPLKDSDPPEPPPVPLKPGELVEPDEAGIKRLLALQRAGLMGDPAERRKPRTRRPPTKPNGPTMLRNFD